MLHTPKVLGQVCPSSATCHLPIPRPPTLSTSVLNVYLADGSVTLLMSTSMSCSAEVTFMQPAGHVKLQMVSWDVVRACLRLMHWEQHVFALTLTLTLPLH